MRLILIRHPKPAVAKGLCYGQTDVPLAEDPADCARVLRACLPEKFHLFSSPLSRARKLAQCLGAPALDSRLLEMNFGQWENQPYDRFQSEIDAWAQDPLGFRPPQGETGHEVAARIRGFFDEVLEHFADGAVVVVGHSGPLRLLITQLLGLPLERQHVFHLDFAKKSELAVHASGTRLMVLNG